jgi:hypothetical protein
MKVAVWVAFNITSADDVKPAIEALDSLEHQTLLPDSVLISYYISSALRPATAASIDVTIKQLTK